MRKYVLFFILFFALCSFTCAQRVRVGAEILIDKDLGLLSGKSIGVICNHTSVLPNSEHIVDALLKKGLQVSALFSPEHGIRGTAPAGIEQRDSVDRQTGVTVYSLYGKARKPTAAMLRKLDVLIFDLQDVGARFYTYASTMAYAMQAAAENGKKIIVLDRPNPLNGETIEGPVLDTALRSFVGMFPIPIRHGLTLGELARMIVGERWMDNISNVDLVVIPMEGWRRTMWYDETGLPWIPPSPNIKTLSTAAVYPGMCLFEATNISEGRGTDHPFEWIGAPWIDGEKLSREFGPADLAGVVLNPVLFTTEENKISSPGVKFKGRQCNGVSLVVTDRSTFKPVETAVRILCRIDDLYPDSVQFYREQMKRLWGTPGFPCAETLVRGAESFKDISRKYLLY